MARSRRTWTACSMLAVAAVAAALVTPPPAAAHGQRTVRFSTFNASLNRSNAGDLVADLSTPGNQQAANVAEIDPAGPARRAAGQRVRLRPGGAAACSRPTTCPCPTTASAPIDYPYRYIAPSRTPGSPRATTSTTTDRSVAPTTPSGSASSPGQFGMAVYSKYPIDDRQGPDVPALPVEGHAGRAASRRPAHCRSADWYSPAELGVFRLSSKSHWDLPIQHRRADRPLPGEPPDAAGVRRASGGPQRASQLRRDPVLGRLHRAGRGQLHLRRRGRRGGLATGGVVRDRR